MIWLGRCIKFPGAVLFIADQLFAGNSPMVFASALCAQYMQLCFTLPCSGSVQKWLWITLVKIFYHTQNDKATSLFSEYLRILGTRHSGVTTNFDFENGLKKKKNPLVIWPLKEYWGGGAVFSDSTYIFLWHESEDINKTQTTFLSFQLILVLPLQVAHDYVHWHCSIYTTVLKLKSC